jgi:hypothetical protein
MFELPERVPGGKKERVNIALRWDERQTCAASRTGERKRYGDVPLSTLAPRMM